MAFEMKKIQGARNTNVFGKLVKAVACAVTAAQEFAREMATTPMSPAVQRNHQQTMR